MNWSIELLNSFPTQAIGWTVVHTFWIGMLVWLLFVLGKSLMGKNSTLRYYYAYALQMILFLAFVGVFGYQYLSYSTTVSENELAGIIELSNTEAVFLAMSSDSKASFFGAILPSIINHMTPFLAFIWTLGALIMLFRFLTNLLYVQNLKTTGTESLEEEWIRLFNQLKVKSGITRGVRFLESSMIKSPVTIGHLKPIILFPIGLVANMPAEQVEAIVLHELAHVKRADYLLNIIQNVVESLIFFHPVTWILSENIRNERENICDDFSVKRTQNPLHLAKALFEIEKQNAMVPDLALGAGKGKLLGRINRLFHNGNTEKRNYNGVIPAILLVIVLLAAPAFNLKKEIDIASEKQITESAANIGMPESNQVESSMSEYKAEHNTKVTESSESYSSTYAPANDDQEIVLKTTTSDGKKIEIVFTNPNNIKKLKVDGKRIDESDYDNYRTMLDKEVFNKINVESEDKSYTYVISDNGKSKTRSESQSIVVDIDTDEAEGDRNTFVFTTSDEDGEVMTIDFRGLEEMDEINEIVEVELSRAMEEMDQAMKDIQIHVDVNDKKTDGHERIIKINKKAMRENQEAVEEALEEAMEVMEEEFERLEKILDEEEMERVQQNLDKAMQELSEEMANLKTAHAIENFEIQMEELNAEQGKLKEEMIIIDQKKEMIKINTEEIEAQCKEIVEMLKEDGLIDEDATKTSIDFKKGKMKVDGKELDEDLTKKYMKILDIDESGQAQYQYQYKIKDKEKNKDKEKSDK